MDLRKCWVLVNVDDVDQHIARARTAGAVVLTEPEDTGHGRQYRAEDVEGHRWMFLNALPRDHRGENGGQSKSG